MSVYFHADISNEKTWERDTPCLCTQNSEVFCAAMKRVTADLKASLRIAANPLCSICKGIGIERVKESDAPFLNLANENARLLFFALGLNKETVEEELWGDLTTAEARRAVMRGKARGSLKPYTRPPAENRRGGGSVLTVGCRWHDPGVSEHGMRTYIVRFEDFLEEAISRGATRIWWD